MAGAFLSLRQVLPDRYPADRDIDAYLVEENSLGRMFDYGAIAPRMQRLRLVGPRTRAARSARAVL